MNWKRQSLVTHFAGCKEGVKVQGRLLELVLQCFPNTVVPCPIEATDTFNDGVFHRKDLGTFIKLNNNWYKYTNDNGMFDFYLFQLNTREINERDQKAILHICETRFATPHQRALAESIKHTLEVRDLVINSRLYGLRFRKKFKERLKKEI